MTPRRALAGAAAVVGAAAVAAGTLFATGQGENQLALTKVAEDASTITLSWKPTGDRGFVFYADGKRVSWTADATRSSARFSKGAGTYRVEAISQVQAGQYPPPPPSNALPAQITQAGSYTGSSSGPIEIRTTGPVTISNCSLTYKGGTIIRTFASTPPDLTLDHCTIDGDTWRLLDVDAFKRIVMTNCTIEKTAGITLVGNGDVVLLRNRHHNIQRVPGGVGNFIQLRIQQAGTIDIGWNEIVNEYGKSDPEDLVSLYHSSNAWVHDNMLFGQFHPGNGPGSSQNGITLDGYGGSGQPVNNNRIENNIVVRALSIAVFPTSTGPASGNLFLGNRVVNAGLLDDGVTRNYYGYQGMSVKPGGTNNQAHGNVLGTMKGTSQGSGRGQDGEFSGEPRGNGNGTNTGAWVDNTRMKLGQVITQADEQAEWDRWEAKLAAAGVTVGS